MDLEILLIECVREAKMLYDPGNENYNDKNLKMKIWNNIARKCEMTSGDAAKLLWYKLRVAYRASIIRSGSAASCSNPWKHEKRMEFLKPFMRDIPLNTNSGEGPEMKLFVLALESFATKSKNHFQSYEEFFTAPCGSKKENPVTPPSKKMEGEIRKSPFEDEDPLKSFFGFMYNTTKNLPVPLQMKVKKRMLQMVMEAEVEHGRTSNC